MPICTLSAITLAHRTPEPFPPPVEPPSSAGHGLERRVLGEAGVGIARETEQIRLTGHVNVGAAREIEHDVAVRNQEAGTGTNDERERAGRIGRTAEIPARQLDAVVGRERRERAARKACHHRAGDEQAAEGKQRGVANQASHWCTSVDGHERSRPRSRVARRLPEAPTYYPLLAGRGSRFLGRAAAPPVVPPSQERV